jgi:hypothetical protein
MKNMKIEEASLLIGREWRALDAAGKKVWNSPFPFSFNFPLPLLYSALLVFLPPKATVIKNWLTTTMQPYEERAAKDVARYLDEYTTVYGSPPPVRSATKKNV